MGKIKHKKHDRAGRMWRGLAKMFGMLVALGLAMMVIYLIVLGSLFKDSSLTVEQARIVIPQYQSQLERIAQDVLNNDTKYGIHKEFTDDQVIAKKELQRIYRDCKIERVYEKNGVVMFICPDPPDGIGFSRFHTAFYYSPDDELRYIAIQGTLDNEYELVEDTEDSKEYRYFLERDPDYKIGYRIERVAPHWIYEYEAAPFRP